MRNWHKWFLLLLGLSFTFLYCKLQTFSFDCSDGYWSNGQCVTDEGVWSFPTVRQCSTVDDRKEDDIGLSKIRGDLIDIDNQIKQAEILLRNLQSRKDSTLAKVANMPKVTYSRTVCSKIEIPTYQSIPRYIVEVGASINNYR